jgi:hypothetical protein
MALTRIQTAALQSSITGSNITDGSILAADLASGSVTPAKLSTGGPNWDSSSNMGVGVSAGGSTRLTVTATSGSLSTFTQTSATGYGLTIIPGADTTYDAFTINNAANTLNKIRMFGDGSASFSSTVGVGLAAPVYPIHVKKNGLTTGITNVYTIGRFLNDAQNKGLDIGYDNTTNQTTLIAYSGGSASGYDFYAYTGSAWYQPMKLTSVGNLLIGNTTENSGTGGLKIGGNFSFGSSSLQATTGNHTIADGTVSLTFYSMSANATVTLPAASTNVGRMLWLRNQTAFTVNSASNNVTLLANGAVSNVILSGTAGKWALLMSDGSYWNIIAAN